MPQIREYSGSNLYLKNIHILTTIEKFNPLNLNLNEFRGDTEEVSLEVIYEAIEDRTGEIKADIARIKSNQEEDFRHLNQRIDGIEGRIDTMMQMLMEIQLRINEREDKEEI